MPRLLVLLALLAGCASEPDPLAFDAYPLSGASAPPSGVPLARQPLSAMPDRGREALSLPTPEADFAGTYAVVSWGCGTLCSMYAVFDTETSEVVGTFESPLDVVYQTDSRLLLVNPPSLPIPAASPGLSDEARMHTQVFVLHDDGLYDLGLRPR